MRKLPLHAASKRQLRRASRVAWATPSANRALVGLRHEDPRLIELIGLMSTARALQLTPSPSSLCLATLAAFGLPKVGIKRMQLVKNFLDVVDVPALSRWL